MGNVTKSLSEIVADLAAGAAEDAERAYDILGAKPGPGTDITVKPVEPICGKWLLYPKTPCGEAFARKFWSIQPLNNLQYSHFLRQSGQWGLTIETDFTFERIR